MDIVCLDGEAAEGDDDAAGRGLQEERYQGEFERSRLVPEPVPRYHTMMKVSRSGYEGTRGSGRD